MSGAGRVLVADDHPPSRAGVAMALRAGGFEVVAEVADGAGAVSAALRTRPDLCLLDVRMPCGGIEAAGEIVAGVPATRVVMLTVSDDEEDVFRALRAGAIGYLLKDTSPERLPAVLCGVLKGEAALPRALMGRVVREFRNLAPPTTNAPRSRPAGLSAREWEILMLLHADLQTTQIAERLSLSPVTIRRHISQALTKLGATNRRDAIRMVPNLTR